MIYQTYPLFRPDDIDNAITFLAESLISNPLINMVEVNPDAKEKGLISKYDIKHFLKSILIDTCKSIYGINAPQMANYKLVENLVKDKLKNTILEYMKLSNIDGYIYDWYPVEISNISLNIISKKSNFKPLIRWNPNEIWNFQESVDDTDKLITSPLNEYLHMNLVIKNVKKDFLDDLIYNKNLSYDIINFQNNCIELKLLPYNNFNKVINIANSLFKIY